MNVFEVQMTQNFSTYPWRDRLSIRICTWVLKIISPKQISFILLENSKSLKEFEAKIEDMLKKQAEELKKHTACKCQACRLHRIKQTGHVDLLDHELEHFFGVAVSCDMFELAAIIKTEAVKRNITLR